MQNLDILKLVCLVFAVLNVFLLLVLDLRGLQPSLTWAAWAVNMVRGPPPRPRPLALAVTNGRLGNQISTYVNHIALSWRFGYSLHLTTDLHSILENVFFNVSFRKQDNSSEYGYMKTAVDFVTWRRNLEKSESNCSSRPRLASEGFLHRCVPAENGVSNIKIKTNHNKPDWPLVFPLLAAIESRHLQLQPSLVARAGEILVARLGRRQQGDTLVGVHVRRGDFGGYSQKRFNIPIINEKYFLAGLDYYRSRYPGCRFVVATDDLAWVRLHLANQPDLVLAQGSPEEDFAVLAACNHSLIAYGSFGVWAALLAGGEVTLPASITQFTGTTSQISALQFGWNLLQGF